LDKQGLLNSQGFWNRRGALIVGTIGGCALVGFNYFYFEEMLAAWVLFTAVWLPLLTAAFLLVVLERAGEIGFLRLSEGFYALPRAAGRRLGPAQWGALRRQLSGTLSQWGSREMGVAEVRTVCRIEQARRRMERINGSALPHHHRRAA
jgi:hypothetical protein